MFMSKSRKGQLVWNNLIPWIIGFGVLALGVVLYLILTEKGRSAINALKNFGGFG